MLLPQCPYRVSATSPAENTLLHSFFELCVNSYHCLQSTNIQRANDMRAKPDLLRSEGSITRSAQAVDEDNTTDQVALQQHGSGPACYQSSPVHSPSAQLATVPEQHTTANSMPEASSAFLATGQPDQISPSAHLTATENQRNVSTTFSSGSCSDSSPSVLANTLHPSLSSSPTLTSLSLPSTMLLSHPNMPTASALPPSSTVLHLPPPFLNPLFVSQTPLPISGQPIQGPLPISWQPIQDPPPSSAIPSTVISIQTAQDHMTAMAAPSAHSNAAAASAAVTHTQHDAKHIMPEASDTTPSEALQPASSSEDGHNLHKHPINGMSASPRTVRSSSSFDFGADGPTRNGFVTAAARPMPHLLEPSQSMPEVDAHAAFQRTDGSKPASHSGISWQSSSSAEPVPSSTQSSRTVLPSQTTQAISQLGHAHPASQTEQASLQSSQTAAAPHTLQVPSVSQVATNLTPGLIQHVNIVEHQAHQRRKAVQRVIELHPASGNRPSVNGSAQHDLAQRTSQRSDQEPETQGNRTKGMFDSVQDSMPASTQLLEQDRQPSRAERAASTTQHSTPSQHSVTHQQALQSQLGLQSPNQAPRSQPEDRLSRGLQALWNKMSHTPLAVPSTASPQRVSPPLLATAGTSPSVEDKTAQHAAEPDGASAAASSSTTKDEISAVQGLNMPALSAVVTSKREGTNVVSSSVACNGEHDHDMATAAMSASEAIDVDAAATPQLRTGSCATRAGISREAIDNIAR